MGVENCGRKGKSHNRANTEQTLAESSPAAARYLKSIVDGRVKGTDRQIKVCQYVIDQDIGRPSQRVVHAGDADNPLPSNPLSLLSLSPEQLETLIRYEQECRAAESGGAKPQGELSRSDAITESVEG